MQSKFFTDRSPIASSQPVAADLSDKSAPIELTLEQLEQVGGGLGPNGTWTTTTVRGPNGTW